MDENGNFIRSQKDIDPYVSRIELSGVVGVSYEINNTWVASAGFTKGLSNAFNNPNDLYKAKNDAFRFGMGYIF